MSRTSFSGLLVLVSLVALGLAAPAEAQSVSSERALLANGYAGVPTVRYDPLLADEPDRTAVQPIVPEQALLGRTALVPTREADPARESAADLDGRRALLGESPSGRGK